MTLRDVVGWLVGGFRKKGAVRLGLFLLGPPEPRTIYCKQGPFVLETKYYL